MKLRRALSFAAGCALALAACSQRGLEPTTPSNASASAPFAAAAARIARKPHTIGTVVITLPPIKPVSAAIAWIPGPNLLSAATQSMAGTIGASAFGPIVLSASTPGCSTVAAGLQCSIGVSAPPGYDEAVSVSTYATADGTGAALATATGEGNVYAGQTNYVATSWHGLAHSIRIVPSSTVVQLGLAQPLELIVFGVDAAGSTIPSTRVLDAGTNGAIKLQSLTFSGWYNRSGNRAMVPCCGTIFLKNGHRLLLDYNGKQTGAESITLTSPNFANIPSTRVTVGPGSSAPAPLIVQNGDDSTRLKTLEFAANANGNVAPIRAFYTTYPPVQWCTCEDQNGDFWIGQTEYSTTGTVLGTLTYPYYFQATDSNGNTYADSGSAGSQTCAVYEYAAGFGTPGRIRELDFTGCTQGNFWGAAATDASGNVFVAVGNGASDLVGGQILEFPPAGSGAVPISRTIQMPIDPTVPDTFVGFVSLDTDAAGNLYGLYYTANFTGSGPVYQLWMYPPGSTTGQQLLAGLDVRSFAVDDAGDVYAAIRTSPSAGAVEEFAPGISTPERELSGLSTQLNFALPIYVAVPRTR